MKEAVGAAQVQTRENHNFSRYHAGVILARGLKGKHSCALKMLPWPSCAAMDRRLFVEIMISTTLLNYSIIDDGTAKWRGWFQLDVGCWKLNSICWRTDRCLSWLGSSLGFYHEVG
ncbi:hypothetical protein OH492_09265 [Vibrio chagasii]|nr:hypothetical protein [Vibrio chagasii]